MNEHFAIIAVQSINFALDDIS